MEEIAFKIDNWCAISPGLEKQNAWLLWHQQNCTWPSMATQVKGDLIPAMMRRRMSHLSKLAVQSALQISALQVVDYIIFASQHGELTRTVALLEDITQGEDASPMAFSQSVHNTAAGLFTIASQRATPVTSIAGAENSLESALIEAYCYLSEFPNNKVLVVDFDEPLPEVYAQYEAQHFQGYALAMIVSKGNNITLTDSPKTEHKQHTLPHGLQLINWLLSGNKSLAISANNKNWHWNKNQ